MIYLNTVPAGGATRFKAVDKIVQPECGKLLAWNNRHPDGAPNPATLHHAMKVRKGLKYVDGIGKGRGGKRQRALTIARKRALTGSARWRGFGGCPACRQGPQSP